MDGVGGVSPLHNFEAEQEVLGAVLSDKAILGRVAPVLRCEYFTEQFHRSLCGAIIGLHERGEPVSPVSIKAKLDPIEFEQGGGNGYLARMASATVQFDAEYVEYQAGHLARLHRRRKLVSLMGETSARATAGESENTLIERLERELSEIAKPSRPSGMVSTPYQWVNPTTIPPRQWLYGRHYIRKFASATVAASGVGKTSVVLSDALSMVTGRDLLTGKSIPQRNVWYWNLEDPREEMERRIQAIALHHGITEDDMGGRLRLDIGRERPFCIATDDRRTGVIVHKDLVDSVTKEIIQRGIDVLILDPFISAHKVVENDNAQIDLVVKTLGRIGDAGNCAVEIVHHNRKGNGNEATVDDARGAVALIAAVRSARIINPMTPDEAGKAGIDPAERRLYFRVDNGKASMAPPGGQASWRKLVSVGLDNGTEVYPEDMVGVATLWAWPDAFAGITVDHLHQVQNRIAAGTWRADAQAEAWVGKPIAETIGLDLDDKKDKAKVKEMIKAWLKSGALVETEKDDDSRKPRKFIEVGEWA